MVRVLTQEYRANMEVGLPVYGMPLNAAAMGSHIKVVKFLIETCGANVNAKCRGEPVLESAIREGRFHTAKPLFEHGANLVTPSSFGPPPLCSAAYSGYPEIAQLLLEHGVDPEARGLRNSLYLPSI